VDPGGLDPITLSRLSVRDVLDGLEVWEAPESNIGLIVEVQASIGNITNRLAKGQLLRGEIQLKHIVIWAYWWIVERRFVIAWARTEYEIEAITGVSTLKLSEREQWSWR
jgi:hypothetical protein